jgi:hypothetical protein
LLCFSQSSDKIGRLNKQKRRWATDGWSSLQKNLNSIRLLTTLDPNVSQDGRRTRTIIHQTQQLATTTSSLLLPSWLPRARAQRRRRSSAKRRQNANEGAWTTTTTLVYLFV